MSYLIKLENITKVYSGGNRVLQGIDFNLQKGEMIAIMGASGSGKSTLMNIIGFLDQNTTGSYFFSGENVSNLSEIKLANLRNKNIGFVFQAFFLLPRLSVLANVMLPLFYRGIADDVAREMAMHMLAKLGMRDFYLRYPNELSGGQQQRIAIARALVGDPEIILADEPTGSLDSPTGQAILDLLIELNQKEKRSIIIVTHDLAVSQRCQRQVMLKDGYIV